MRHSLRFKILAVVIWICSLTGGSATAETLSAVKLWNPGSRNFETLGDAISFSQSQWCVGNMFACSTEYVGETFSPSMGRWYFNTILRWSTRDAEGKVQSFSSNSSGAIFFDCPAGFFQGYSTTSAEGYCGRPDDVEAPCFLCGPAAQKVGNPIFLARGVKQQVEVDYTNTLGTLQFVRTYRSDHRRWQHNYSSFAIDMNFQYIEKAAPNSCFWGKGMTTGKWLCYEYGKRNITNDVLVRRSNGRLMYFGTSTDLRPNRDVNDRVTPVLDGAGQRLGMQVKNGDTDAVEIYDLKGRIATSTARNGQVTTFTYSAIETPREIAPREGLLIAVTDAFGRSLQFTYDDREQLVTMTDPAGGVYRYSYGPDKTLDKVTYPDGKERRYIYGEADLTSGVSQPYVLTGIIDENNVRFAIYKYDKNGRAISTEHAGGVEKYVASYPAYGQATVVDPLGTSRTYVSDSLVGVYRATYETQPDLILGTGYTRSKSIGYDTNGNISSYRDFNDSKTTYTYDLARNLETKRVEGSGSPVARTINTEWHPTFRLPQRIAEPKRITSYIYDDHGNMVTRTVRATTDLTGASGFAATLTGSPQVWTYTYDSFGHVLTAQGPRTDINTTTTYTYDGDGNLATVTNAAGHVTSYSNYDAHGRVGRLTDPNGLVTDLTYNPRGWLLTVLVGGETTSYEHDNVGQITQVTLPDGSSLYYTYDDAHRLTGIRDSLGNSVAYVLDAMGNRTNEQSKDANGVLTRQISRVYDALNRVKQITGALQ